MADEIIEELWAVKDAIAKEAGYDVDMLVALLQARQKQREADHNTDSVEERAGNSTVPNGIPGARK